jgi:predicted permease
MAGHVRQLQRDLHSFLSFDNAVICFLQNGAKMGRKDQIRDSRRNARALVFGSTLQDVRYGLRQLSRNPGFTVVAALVLALGIGANTAIFSLLDAVMLRSLPVGNPEQLLVPRWTARDTPHPFNVGESEPYFAGRAHKPEGSCSFSYPVFKLMQTRTDLFESATAFAGPTPVNSKASGLAAQIWADVVDGSFFQTLRVHTAAGRPLLPQDDASYAEPAVVLSYGYWQSAFGGDPAAVGKTVRLKGVPFTVAGIAESRFNQLSLGRPVDLWLTLHAAARLSLNWVPAPLEDGHTWWLKIIARRRPEVTPAQIEAALTLLFRQELIGRSNILKADADPSIEVTIAGRALTGIRNMLAKPLYVLMAGVGMILLIACANIASLTSARGASRQREVAIRLAVGASRGRIVCQLLTESLLLAGMGAAAGLAFAYWGARSLNTFLPVHLVVKPDMRILLFTTAVSIAAGILFGMMPAVRSTRIDVISTVKSGAGGLQQRMSSAGRHLRFGNSLLAAQVALATVMLAGAGLLMRTLFNLKNTEIGFNAQHLLVFGLSPDSTRYGEAELRALYRTLRDRFATLPGVTGVTYSDHVLLSGAFSSSDYRIEGREDQRTVSVKMLGIGPDFLKTMGVPLLAGRAFEAADFTSTRRVALVNRAFVSKYLEGRNPLGLHFGEGGPNNPQNEIAGVVGDALYDSLREEVQPTAYVPLKLGGAYFELRTANDPSTLISAIRKTVQRLDDSLPVHDIKTQRQQIDELLFVERLLTLLACGFGILALTLTCIGLYGLLSYQVAWRTREIGIRIAIGAAPRRVQSAILGETLAIVATGLAIGLPAALIATRALASTLYRIRPNDPATLAGGMLVMLAVAAVAGYLPARRASLVDPMVSLREE